MKVEAVNSALYTAPVQKIRPLSPDKRSSVIESYNQVMAESTTEKLNTRRFDRFERIGGDEEKPDFKAINLIKKSEIPPPEPPTIEELRESRASFAPKIELRRDITELRGEEAELSGISADVREEARTERIEKSASVKTSDEIEKEASGNNKLTPAQQRGVEVYQRIQRYADPLSLSNAQMAV